MDIPNRHFGSASFPKWCGTPVASVCQGNPFVLLQDGMEAFRLLNYANVEGGKGEEESLLLVIGHPRQPVGGFKPREAKRSKKGWFDGRRERKPHEHPT